VLVENEKPNFFGAKKSEFSIFYSLVYILIGFLSGSFPTELYLFIVGLLADNGLL
jgi:hypothetical protein